MNHTDQFHRTIDRRGILELLARIVGGLGMASTIPLSARAEENSSEDKVTIDDGYLVKGLTGMARAKGWFDAHWVRVFSRAIICAKTTRWGMQRRLQSRDN